MVSEIPFSFISAQTHCYPSATYVLLSYINYIDINIYPKTNIKTALARQRIKYSN